MSTRDGAAVVVGTTYASAAMLAPADRSAALIFVTTVALLLHLGMLIGTAHPGQLHAVNPTDAVGMPAGVLDVMPDAAAAQPAAEHSGASAAHLMLQLCLATVAAAVVVARPGPRRLVQSLRTEAGASDPPPRVREEHPPPPGRSRIDAGLVLRV
jgi:hypothetical protein